ncbi:hypothetical protein N7E02_08400 [Aliirhizobium terrae]|uniref:hypothetical protein n=1 Tax=Terrirhizobium terrae TaxID=2926709 RepID=UPI002575A827|nr:hypothetical protein [Rhizobium sp. CC-CFT758]WJH40620.1 hypothetical protein N7E02_08400 [Rhizobium sp. CC-CFT758]
MTPSFQYEPEMRVIYDIFTKEVLVTFRGEVRMLGPFPDKKAATAAAEDFCRSKGWQDH